MRGDRNQVVNYVEQVLSDYQAAKSSRFSRRRTGIASGGSGADYHYRNENQWLKLLEYARDMDRNDCVVGQIVDRLVANVIQDGFELDVNSGDTGLDDELLNRWKDWSSNPDECCTDGESTFADLQALVFRHCVIDGDIVSFGTDDGQLQMFEAHRCRTPRGGKRDFQNVVHGVELDGFRRRTAYYLFDEEISPLRAVRQTDKFTRRDTLDGNGVRRVFHPYLPKRLTQTRGVTALAPCFDPASIHDDIQFAAALKQQTHAAIVLFRKKAKAPAIPSAGKQYGETTVETRGDGSQRLVDKTSPLIEVEGEIGEELQGFQSSAPGEQFSMHVRVLLTIIGINLGMPLILVTMDGSETNFSGWRGAFEQAKLGFRSIQRRQARRWNTPILGWKVAEWCLADSVLLNAVRRAAEKRGDKDDGRPIPGINHSWKFPRWPHIQPLQDRMADAYGVANCLVPARIVSGNDGRDFFTDVDLILEERTYAILRAKRRAMKINARFPDDPHPVRWDQLYAFPSQDGVRTSIALQGGASEDGSTSKKKPGESDA